MAVKLALAGDKSIADVARELEMPSRNLYDWVKAWKGSDVVIASKYQVRSWVAKWIGVSSAAYVDFLYAT